MKIERLKISQIEIESFITSVSDSEKLTAAGGVNNNPLKVVAQNSIYTCLSGCMIDCNATIKCTIDLQCTFNCPKPGAPIQITVPPYCINEVNP